MPTSHRLAAAALIGTSGTLVMLAMLWPHWHQDWPFLIAATLGASLAGWCLADCFGKGRSLGLVLVGAVVATLLGAALAGLGLGLIFGAGLEGMVIGPAAVGQALLTQPHVLITWGLCMATSHLALSALQNSHLIPS